MNNFLDFIEKDIEAKKTLISTMPTKTKTNIRKFNESIDIIEAKYNDYRDSVRNYLTAKAKSFEVKNDTKNLDKLNETIQSLEHVKFLLNPSNTYFEKMGFDNLLYQINNYYVFNFKSLDGIINAFLDKFELADIRLNSDDFDYTYYVHQYMNSFLEVRYKKTDGYEKVSEIFEQIYWLNPEIIEHIELNFRKLIRKNERKFNNYISKLQRTVMEKNKIKSYSDCIEKLEAAYVELVFSNKESIKDIVELAKKGEIDINQYPEDSKVRIAAFDSLIVESVDKKNESSMKKIYSSLEKLKLNIDEYNSYLEFLPIFDDFKNEYKDLIPKDSKKPEYKGLKTIETEIATKEAELDKINRKIFGGRPLLFETKNESGLKQLKIDSLRKAKELYELYKKYDQEYFKDKVLAILSNTLTVEDLLHLYYSFDYFKKLTIQKVYNITTYDEIIKYSETFDLFAMDSTTIIVDGTLIFEESNIPKIISNKYRLSNIKVTEDDLSPDGLEQLKNKILLLLRINNIEHSEISIDKIWFVVNVEKIIAKELKEAEEGD